jgi:hypothetical protein
MAKLLFPNLVLLAGIGFWVCGRKRPLPSAEQGTVAIPVRRQSDKYVSCFEDVVCIVKERARQFLCPSKQRGSFFAAF